MRNSIVALAALTLAACSQSTANLHLQTGPETHAIGGGGRTATFEYLGAGGWLIRRGSDAVLTAPFFTNPSFLRLPFRTSSNHAVVQQHLDRLGNLDDVRVVVTGHAHYDHIMDLPEVLPRVPASAPIVGGVTVCNTLASALAGHACESMLTRAGTRNAAATPFNVNARVRVLPYFSEHASHVAHIRALNGHYASPLAHVPAKPNAWREGETLAYLIDFLDANGAPELRVWYVDASPNTPYGLPDDATLHDKRVDVAIFCVGNWNQQADYPKAYLAALAPSYALLGHWENFFRSADRPPLALRAADVGAFEALVAQANVPYTLPDRHKVITIQY
ncbi:MAG: hypothetical protein JO197_18805 [Acidobacteria bacterium]|nr:hypothetical protein [Acidobacteriota bacterium]MBV9477143.1 hypothetical protein [Acidobacteriota bacterium]